MAAETGEKTMANKVLMSCELKKDTDSRMADFFRVIETEYGIRLERLQGHALLGEPIWERAQFSQLENYSEDFCRALHAHRVEGLPER